MTMMTMLTSAKSALAVLTIALASPGPSTRPAAPVVRLDPAGRRMAALAEKVRPLLVTVHFTVTRKLDERTQRILGSVRGLVVARDGLVVTIGEMYPRTADRVVGTAAVEPPKEVKVILDDGSEVPADFLGKDYDLNLSFLRMKRPPEGLDPLPLSPPGRLVPGRQVVVFGRLPHQYGRKVWFMPVRVAARVDEPRELYFTPAPIMQAVGGPVLDEKGLLVGLVALDARTVRPDNNPTAPPRRVTTAVIVPAWALAAAVQNPPAVRPARQDGWLGIAMDPLQKDLAEALDLPVKTGIMVSRVYPGTPAEKAGLAVEDVITAVDGRPLAVTGTDDLVEFRKRIVAAGAGAKMKLTVYRKGKKRTLTVTLGASPKSAAEAERVKLEDFGFTARELVFTDTIQPGSRPGLAGVKVAAVESAGWAGLGGLRPGDIIQRVNELPVRTLAEFRSRIKTIRKGRPKEVVFFVRRGTETAFVRVEPQWK